MRRFGIPAACHGNFPVSSHAKTFRHVLIQASADQILREMSTKLAAARSFTFEATREIARQLPETAIVMLTVSRADADLFDALCAGASGYLLKDMDPARLPAALRGVLEGEAALPRHLVALVIEEFRERRRHRRLSIARQRGIDLTEREWEVLEMLREGLSTSEIAERMFIAPVTVRTHVSAVLKKLHVPDREAAVKLLDR